MIKDLCNPIPINKLHVGNYRQLTSDYFSIVIRNNNSLHKLEQKRKVDTVDIIINIPIIKTKSFNENNFDPWWNQESDSTIIQSKEALNISKHNKNMDSLIELKKRRAVVKRVINQAKKDSLREYVESINADATLTNIWNMVEKITFTNSSMAITI